MGEDIFIGKQVGKLTVAEMGPMQGERTVWKCICDCGNYIVVSTINLKKDKVKDCGCSQKPKEPTKPKTWKVKVDPALDAVGKKFGMLTVISVGPKGSRNVPRKVVVKCDCGVETEKLYYSVVRGLTKSCGCLVHSQAAPMLGRTFEKLKVVSKVDSATKLNSSQVRWSCECECGNTVSVSGPDLRRGVRKDCGCVRKNRPKPPKKIKEKVYRPKKNFSKVGQKIGKLSVIGEVNPGAARSNTSYNCRCDCGNDCVVTHAYLSMRRDKASCGCLSKASRETLSLNLEGVRHGLLVAIRRGPRRKYSGKVGKFYTTWICKCDCGNEAIVESSKFNQGRILSCGCSTNKAVCKTTGINNSKHSRRRDNFRKSPEYVAWRTAVFTRDRFRCIKCGGNHGGVNAHHLEDYASNPELRVSVDNGVTLCVACHKEFHNTYGWIEQTTTQQFDEFMCK